MSETFTIRNGIETLEGDIPAVIKMIERTAKWVNPETYRRLPVWAPHAARGKPLYDATWTRAYTNTNRTSGQTANKREANVSASKAFIAALGVAAPKPKHWTVCHIWGYGDSSFASSSDVVKDHRFFSCVANMVWLPTPLKGFTDEVPQIQEMLRVCAFHLYAWACEYEKDPLVIENAKKIRSGWVPPDYPKSWPSPDRPGIHPPGTAPFTKRIEQEIIDRKLRIKEHLHNETYAHYPRPEVQAVLDHWKIDL